MDMTPKKNFYVSAIDGDRKFLVAGPYGTHNEALAMVAAVNAFACDHDPRACFMAWGTAGSVDPIKTPLGKWTGACA
jgi:hypothetical protein